MKSFACYLIAIGISAGAFGAHSLRHSITPERLDVFNTAVFYQITISILLLNFINMNSISSKVTLTLAAGIIIFSGSLYTLVLFDLPWLGAITPVGGLLMILSIVAAGFKIKN